MTTIYYVPETNVLRVFVKASRFWFENLSQMAHSLVQGAPEVIIRDARDVMLADGTIRPCTEEDRAHLTALVASYAGNAYRTLCVGFRDVPASLYATDPSASPLLPGQSVEGRYFVDLKNEPLDRGIILQALFGISDPVRPEVPDAVRKVRAKCRFIVGLFLTFFPQSASRPESRCGC